MIGYCVAQLGNAECGRVADAIGVEHLVRRGQHGGRRGRARLADVEQVHRQTGVLAPHRRDVVVPGTQHSIDSRLAVAHTRLERGGEVFEHDAPLATGPRDGPEPVVDDERAQHLVDGGIGRAHALDVIRSSTPRIAATDRSTSASVVDQLDTEIRAAATPRQTVPPNQDVPSAWAAAMTRRVVSSESPKRTTTWLSTTSFSTSTPGTAASCSAKRRASAQHQSTRSATPERPSMRNAAHTARPRARRELSGTKLSPSRSPCTS